MADEPRVVEAVGVATRAEGSALSVAIEKAMADAVLQCLNEGISLDEVNTPVIQERMRAARQAVLDNAAVATAAESIGTV